jgi:glycosyltransferase involved in cell wall biosynthesis
MHAAVPVRQPDTTLVCVVVPAYNAAATLDETLCSVRAQTHRALEIIVVDDGSSDETPAIVERHAVEDPRLRLLRQANAGVAAARNAGWRAAKADLISFIDADDLWAPTKIERQLQALEQAGPSTGLAYCWTARLAEDGTVSSYHDGVSHVGDALSALLRSNYIGSGSNVLVRRQALVDTDGFDAGLREAGAQGCEDWLFCCRVAQSHHFACVPEYLVGYRYRERAMSRDRRQMLRSHVMMCTQLIRKRADRRAVLTGLQAYSVWLLRDARARGEWREWMPLWLTVWRRYPWVALRVVWGNVLLDPVRRVRDRLRRPRRVSRAPAAQVLGQHFLNDAARMQP